MSSKVDTRAKVSWGKRDYDQVRDSPFFPPYKGECLPPLCDTRTSTLDARGYYRLPGDSWEHRHYVTLEGGDPAPTGGDGGNPRPGYIDPNGNIVESNKTNSCPQCDTTGPGLKNSDASGSIVDELNAHGKESPSSIENNERNQYGSNTKDSNSNKKDSNSNKKDPDSNKKDSDSNEKDLNPSNSNGNEAGHAVIDELKSPPPPSRDDVADTILRQAMPKKLPEAEKKKIESLITDDVKNAAMKDAVLKNVGKDGKLNPKIDDNILKAFKDNLEKKEKAIEKDLKPPANDLRPPPSADKAPEHPKPPMPFADEEKEMLAPVNPHMDSVQMVKTQKTKQHAMEQLAKSMNKDVVDGKRKLDKVPLDKPIGDIPSKIKKAKLKPPPPPKPKPPQEEEEEEDSKQDADAKDLKSAGDANKNPKAPSVFDPNATKVGADGKVLEALNKEAGLDKDCSPLPRPTIPFGDVTGKLGQPKLEVPIPGGPCGVPKVPLPGDPPPAEKKKSCGKGLLGKLMCIVKKVAKGVKKAGEKLGPAAAKAAAAAGAAGKGAEAKGDKKGGSESGGEAGKGKCGKNLIGKIACFVKKVVKKAHNHIKKAFEFKSRSTKLQNINTSTQQIPAKNQSKEKSSKGFHMLRGMNSF